ncbi:MAG: hypothetical protein JRN26_07020 [Nitrososphaerota archaeon]|jgi:hypothetical protein|nr:hypothetical protein [Nitrososphaerota archaeon]MDG6927400.1 hypothetical protein [Nitrososphaerota archaeon]MDG6931204.1 hypothetical protein [Nitrososphaerota archaeon]MDG6931867.1 hypothetical protein [Nitrososphaerota archaeon]MDG6936613.1 hypothetical protein [Nitrososphaerota archaeon]
MADQLTSVFKISDQVKSERGALGTVVNFVNIQGKSYIKVQWKNGTYGIYGNEEIKRYKIKRMT